MYGFSVDDAELRLIWARWSSVAFAPVQLPVVSVSVQR